MTESYSADKLAYIKIEEIPVYREDGTVIAGLAAYEIKASFGTPTYGSKILDTHWQESVAWKCACNWRKRYEQAGYLARIL